MAERAFHEPVATWITGSDMARARSVLLHSHQSERVIVYRDLITPVLQEIESVFYKEAATNDRLEILKNTFLIQYSASEAKLTSGVKESFFKIAIASVGKHHPGSPAEGVFTQAVSAGINHLYFGQKKGTNRYCTDFTNNWGLRHFAMLAASQIYLAGRDRYTRGEIDNLRELTVNNMVLIADIPDARKPSKKMPRNTVNQFTSNPSEKP